MGSLARIRRALQRTAAQDPDTEDDATLEQQEVASARQVMLEVIGRPPPLDLIVEAFGLSGFERDILLLCAGMSLDSRFASLCATIHDDPNQAWPTFGLALAALPEPQWPALLPDRPLRRWQLIEIDDEHALTRSALRISERVLHYLAGFGGLDAVLVRAVDVLAEYPLVPSYARLVGELATAWSAATEPSDRPVIQLCGANKSAKRPVAAAVGSALGRDVWTLSAHSVPTVSAEWRPFLRLWEREDTLSPVGLLLDCDDLQHGDAAQIAAVGRLIDGFNGLLMVSSTDPVRTTRPSLTVDVKKPTPAEQVALWHARLAEYPTVDVETLVGQFDLSEDQITAAAYSAIGRLAAEPNAPKRPTPEALSEALWQGCRAQARPHMADLAQRVTAAPAWQELVVPETVEDTLRRIVLHVRYRRHVNDLWGFGADREGGMGTAALFAGPSGTGKTLAAAVLATELRLDLFRIDLSSTVSKYIGETEKNLRRIFDAADDGGAILLFDEADALFGKRSEVRDSHDRFANIEISYLLQRMEAYRGLAILTTNMEEAVDQAFVRRLGFIARFPFPDASQREEIWRRVFPPATPVDGLDPSQLARLNVTGASIRSIAHHAAFLAAAANQPVRMEHVYSAAVAEYSKLKRVMTTTERAGWAF